MALGRRSGLVLLLASLLGALLVACEDEEQPELADVPPPSTPEEFLERLERALTREDNVWHVNAVTTSLADGEEQVVYRTEAWLHLANGEGRIERRRDPALELDQPLHELELTHEGDVYRWSEDIPIDPVDAIWEHEANVCVPGDAPRLVRIIGCSLLSFSYGNIELGVDESASFESRPTYALMVAVRYEPPSRDLPAGGPTHPPARTSVSRLHVDRESFLPVGIDHDDDAGQTTFEGGWLERSSLPGDFFDPKAIGYVTPAERELGILENPALGVSVYWLGPKADIGNGLPPLELGELFDHHPEIPRPAASDEPNVRIRLPYAGDGGRVELAHWQPGEWEKFKARLGGKFAWAWCSDTVEKELGDARLVILRGHEPPPYDPGAPQVATPGAPPPPATVPPLRTDPCPEKPYDRFMAEVHYADVTVVINGTLFYGGQEGDSFGAFDDPAALEAVAGALRLRGPGE